MSVAKKEYKRITVKSLVDMKKRGEKISMLTAYDYSMAKIMDGAGIDVILVGDSASNALAVILREARENECILIDFFCTAEEVGKELSQHGFFPESSVSSKIPYLFRPIHYADGISLAIDLPPHQTERSIDYFEWYFTKGDNDIDRIKL